MVISLTVPSTPCAEIKSPTLNGLNKRIRTPPAKLDKEPWSAKPMARPAAPITATNDAVYVARRILQTVGSHVFPDLDPDFRITASIGIATCPDHAESEQELIKAADAAMYQAKESDEQIAITESREEK